MTTNLITDRWAWDSGLTAITQSETLRIRDLLVGHKVTKVADDHLLLDDGTLLRVVPNEGGCSCGAGDYELTELNGVDNVITAVDVVDDVTDDKSWEEAHTYRVYVFADNERVNLFTVEGDDGNGYYGTGYSILVRKP